MKITITGWAGTGKSTTAKLLAAELGYPHFSGGNIFRSYADSQNMTLNELERHAEHDTQFDYKLDNYQKELGEQHDNFVMESRLGWFFIPDAYKIMLFCDDEERMRRIAERDEIDSKQAQHETLDREESIVMRYKDLYDIDDFMNVEHFDLVIDTEQNNPEQVLSIILSHLK